MEVVSAYTCWIPETAKIDAYITGVCANPCLQDASSPQEHSNYKHDKHQGQNHLPLLLCQAWHTTDDEGPKLMSQTCWMNESR